MKILNTLLFVACISLITSGCSTTSVERITDDGTKFKATNRRAIWNSKGVEVSYETQTNGTIKASAKIDQSGSDAAALTEGIITGLKKVGVIKGE